MAVAFRLHKQSFHMLYQYCRYWAFLLAFFWAISSSEYVGIEFDRVNLSPGVCSRSRVIWGHQPNLPPEATQLTCCSIRTAGQFSPLDRFTSRTPSQRGPTFPPRSNHKRQTIRRLQSTTLKPPLQDHPAVPTATQRQNAGRKIRGVGWHRSFIRLVVVIHWDGALYAHTASLLARRHLRIASRHRAIEHSRIETHVERKSIVDLHTATQHPHLQRQPVRIGP